MVKVCFGLLFLEIILFKYFLVRYVGFDWSDDIVVVSGVKYNEKLNIIINFDIFYL